jgi:HEPN domain
MKWTPGDYRLTALQRIGEARRLKELERYALAMYVSGVAAECMLRAFLPADAWFDDRHDLVELFRACAGERLGEHARERLSGPIQTIHLLWLNSFRFAHDQMVRARARRIGYGPRPKRGADLLKLHCIQLFNACTEVVTVGEQRWRSL